MTPPLTEAERFIEMNTEKITENKYLCPLSGKKFKGPEFVKKHIFNKHMDKVNAVKQEVSATVAGLCVCVWIIGTIERPIKHSDKGDTVERTH